MNRDELTDVYRRQMVELLQEGPAWAGFREADGDGNKLLAAKADAFAVVHGRLDALLREGLPWLAVETLSARETEVGLPDACTKGCATVLTERQMAVRGKWLGAGAGHRSADFAALAAQLGYSVTVTTARPMRLGSARCGQRLNPAAAAFHLRVTVHGPRKVYARCGPARCGDPLLRIERAADLECRLRKKVHTHVDLAVTYESK